MSPPIFNPDGPEVNEIVLPDGATASEVIGPDGNVVFEAGPDIPDSGDLQARWTAKDLSQSDGQTVSTWTDATGNGHDLTAGAAPTYKTSIINGNPVVRFDGVGDHLSTAFSTISQPNTIFGVFQLRSFDTSAIETIYGSENDNSDSTRQTLQQPNSNDWRHYAGNTLDGGTPDTNAHVFTAQYDGASSYLRLDGSSEVSGDAGNEGLNGFQLGARWDVAAFGAVDIGEILIYPMDKSGIQSDVESYLSAEWGITV